MFDRNKLPTYREAAQKFVEEIERNRLSMESYMYLPNGQPVQVIELYTISQAVLHFSACPEEAVKVMTDGKHTASEVGYFLWREMIGSIDATKPEEEEVRDRWNAISENARASYTMAASKVLLQFGSHGSISDTERAGTSTNNLERKYQMIAAQKAKG